MKNLDIEAYLDGDLAGEALQVFEQELLENPDFARRIALQRQIRQHLRRQMLREHVAAARAAKPRTGVFRTVRWLVGALLVLLAVCLFVVLEKTENAPPPVPHEQKGEQKLENPLPAEPSPASEKPAADPILEKKQQPIAARKTPKLRPPDYPAPNIRGSQRDNSAWKKTLDQIWYTQFPPQNTIFNEPFSEIAGQLAARDFENAFVQLEILETQQPQNDTLRLLKAHCLLEMGEAAEALRYFEYLENRQPDWNNYLQWHRSLSFLLLGDTQKALPALRKIADTPEHPFRLQSRKALKVLSFKF